MKNRHGVEYTVLNTLLSSMMTIFTDSTWMKSI
jgi:hypothetical protein